MISNLTSAALFGIDALQVHIEVDLSESDKLNLVIVGLPDTAVKESKDRVLSAIRNSGYSIGAMQCVINLAPGDLKKEGPLYDLPIALGMLHAKGLIKSSLLSDYLCIGELSLSGEVRSTPGTLLLALLAKQIGKKGIIVSRINAKEAAVIQGLDIIAVSHLKEAIRFLESGKILERIENDCFTPSQDPLVDFFEIKGQHQAKRALEIAAAGNHNLLMCGPPGSGKTLLAKAMMGIMPELSLEEAIEITKIHSIAGILPEGASLVLNRPFRSPHHTISYAGLIGGGSYPRPGEVSLAHNGILFLDELPEFSRHTLEVLRQPLEDRQVIISRALGNFKFPANFLFLAAMNPCPCGYLGHTEKVCRDSEKMIYQYRSKISGPLLDRIDIHLEIPSLKYHELINDETVETSALVRQRVKMARQRQSERLGPHRTNSQITPKEIKSLIDFSNPVKALMKEAVEQLGISARSFDRILRVALTIADLAQESFKEDHLLEALQFKNNGFSLAHS